MLHGKNPKTIEGKYKLMDGTTVDSLLFGYMARVYMLLKYYLKMSDWSIFSEIWEILKKPHRVVGVLFNWNKRL